jgi:hypothetical protein
MLASEPLAFAVLLSMPTVRASIDSQVLDKSRCRHDALRSDSELIANQLAQFTKDDFRLAWTPAAIQLSNDETMQVAHREERLGHVIRDFDAEQLLPYSSPARPNPAPCSYAQRSA